MVDWSGAAARIGGPGRTKNFKWVPAYAGSIPAEPGPGPVACRCRAHGPLPYGPGATVGDDEQLRPRSAVAIR